MNNKGVGVIFCLTAALLMSARYIAAAIFLSSTKSWSSDLFQASLGYVGWPLTAAAIAALVAGVCFLGYGVFQDHKKQGK